ncbi:hypothetical protein BRADI_1g43710v3 [Brachypodium distachyon]|uniref:HTH myb-type domain-containing protein n=2 Tax=Brachypodium distachyon TaxID=15368 RepID=I1GZ35_BRADI|nr:hypothetical protein BRADI_1g43710v3 [Brachypodium distachyon]
MLAVSTPRCGADAEDQRAVELETAGAHFDMDQLDFTVDDIDFGDFFLRLEHGDALPDLEVDDDPAADIFSDFEAAVATGGAVEELQDQEVPCDELLPGSLLHDDVGSVSPTGGGVIGAVENMAFAEAADDGEKEGCNQAMEDGNVNCNVGGNGAAMEDAKSPCSTASSSQEAESRHKSSRKKNSHGKKKAKVDWTPELHRRFVQAVEQLGIDKAVPSRILEIMGIDSLTRHNIASHLQKYRSHRKHMLAREAEAASWTQRRHAYAAGGPAGAAKKQETSMWTVPTIGFSPSPAPLPPPPPPPHPAMQHFARPLHVWGHPSTDPHSPRVAVWPPRHPATPRGPVPPPPPSWAAPPPTFWHHPYMRGPAHAYMPATHGTPCVAMPMAPAKFPAPPVAGVMPCPVYTPLSAPASKKQQDSQLQLQAQPSNESIDAAIGDVLTKPWLPLPLGLKPPSLGSVMGELQRQGVSNVPQACG